MEFSKHEIEHRFTYHAPDKDKIEIHAFIRHEAFKFATAINDYCPASSESIKAISAIEEAVFWANAAIARHDLERKIPK